MQKKIAKRLVYNIQFLGFEPSFKILNFSFRNLFSPINF